MTWLISAFFIGLVVLAIAVWVVSWMTSLGRARIQVNEDDALEEIRAVRIDALRRIGEAARQQSSPMRFAGVDGEAQPDAIHAPLRALIHEPDGEQS
jgi:hypothetical protein